MKSTVTNPCHIAVILALFGFSLALPVLASDRNLILEPLQDGPFAVGSMNFTIDAARLTALLNSGGDAGQLQQGLNEGDSLRYIDELLAFPDDAFFFQLSIPNNANLYGDQAGNLMPYVGHVVYPTSTENTRPDYDLFGNTNLPRMQREGEKPIFADETAKYPLLVYSHGNGDHPTADQFTANVRLASHGYIVLSLYHGDNRFDQLTPQHFNLRPLAVKTAVDELLGHADFGDHIDAEQIGGYGGSFGGATMLALLGAQRVNPDPGSVLLNLLTTTTVDSRFKAAAGIVPYAGAGVFSFFGSGGAGAASVDRPFMAHSSNADEVADYAKIQEVMNQLTGSKYLIEYDGVPHAFSSEAGSDAAMWIKQFFDAYVKEETTAIANLSALHSISGGSNEQLVVVNEVSTGPAEVIASFSNNQLSVPGVSVGADRFDVVLTLTAAEVPTFTLVSAEPAAGTGSAGSFAGTTLSIPTTEVEGVRYSVELTLTGDNPITFVLSSATPI